jgi:hypothetical protein
VYRSSSWVGIDGAFGAAASPDVLQAGVGHNVIARPGGPTSLIYHAWYEWFPDFEIRITNLNVQPGDDVL